MSNYQVIMQAIQDKVCITCMYNGYIRKMIPLVLGTKNGIEQALCYQYGGQSASGLSPDSSKNWRCIPIAKMTELSINQDPFQTVQNFSKLQTCVDLIDMLAEI